MIDCSEGVCCDNNPLILHLAIRAELIRTAKQYLGAKQKLDSR
jgi:hypothetical protein